MDRLKIIHGDAAAELGKLADASIDLVVTSPPYDNARTYNGTLDWNFEAIAMQLYRVMVPGGIVVMS